ncbi:hypothetical protein AC1031_018859 [Aphanomyces cochlioides]|nr:hypothetical protein AC1031_018859 [Aphanomyces cochlioides]
MIPPPSKRVNASAPDIGTTDNEDDKDHEKKRHRERTTPVKETKIPRLGKTTNSAPQSPASVKKASTSSKIPRIAKADSSGIPRLASSSTSSNSSRKIDMMSETTSEYASSEYTSECPTNTASQLDVVSQSGDLVGFASSLRELEIARCLQEDLLQDNAKLKIQTEAIHDEIRYYYDLLAQVEAVAHGDPSPAPRPDYLAEESDILLKPVVGDDVTF